MLFIKKKPPHTVRLQYQTHKYDARIDCYIHLLQCLLLLCHFWCHRFHLRPVLSWFEYFSFGLYWPSFGPRGLREAGFVFLQFWRSGGHNNLPVWRRVALWAGCEHIHILDFLTSDLRRVTTGGDHLQTYILNPPERQRQRLRGRQ